MKRIEVIIGGVGGQGCAIGGNFLAKAAAIHEGRESLMASSYGSEARGTFTKSEVIISDSAIAFPHALDPDFVFALDPISYEKYVDGLKPGKTLIYDSDTVTRRHSQAEQKGFSLSGAAVRAGNIASINIVALGILIKMTGIIRRESLEKVLAEQFGGKEKILDINLKALELGIEMAEGAE